MVQENSNIAGDVRDGKRQHQCEECVSNLEVDFSSVQLPKFSEEKDISHGCHLRGQLPKCFRLTTLLRNIQFMYCEMFLVAKSAAWLRVVNLSARRYKMNSTI